MPGRTPQKLLPRDRQREIESERESSPIEQSVLAGQGRVPHCPVFGSLGSHKAKEAGQMAWPWHRSTSSSASSKEGPDTPQSPWQGCPGPRLVQDNLA